MLAKYIFFKVLLIAFALCYVVNSVLSLTTGSLGPAIKLVYILVSGLMRFDLTRLSVELSMVSR